jgi:hypothetical protein
MSDEREIVVEVPRPDVVWVVVFADAAPVVFADADHARDYLNRVRGQHAARLYECPVRTEPPA